MRLNLARCALLAGAGWALGLAVGSGGYGLAIGVFVAWAVELRTLFKLSAALQHGRALKRSQRRDLVGVVETQLFARHETARQRLAKFATALRIFRRAAAGLPEGVVLVDPAEQRIVAFNPAAATLLDLSRRDRRRPLAQILRGGRARAWLDAPGPGPLTDLASPTDPNRRLELAAIAIREGQLIVVRDVTQLQRLEQIRRDFVGNVSHELRTPLTVLHGYLEQLEPEDLPGLAPMLAEMRAQSARMRQLVEDLLTLSRVEQSPEGDRETVSMAAMLSGLVADARALSGGRHSIELEDRAALDLLGSANDLRSAFSNLVSNAVRYTPDGGSIAISFRHAGEGAEFAVTDTGYGIPAQHLPRITERFYRVSTSRSRASGGTGLGLAIVRHVLLRHAATLDIESEVGHGSRFSCRFGAASVMPRLAAA